MKGKVEKAFDVLCGIIIFIVGGVMVLSGGAGHKFAFASGVGVRIAGLIGCILGIYLIKCALTKKCG